ncbi:hypothetical protein IL306_011554 [Fusarium sp. DS 682]|nr:hypothetical protein IL306_011554 [Fusarium sp. DS 682]
MAGRAAIFDFTNNLPTSLFDDPAAFADSLRNQFVSPKLAGVRLLVVLEGLSPDWTAPLETYLEVPPSVIALHREWPGDHATGKCRVPLGESPDRHAILRYRQPLPFRLRRKRKDCRYYFARNTNNGHAIRTIDSPIRKVDDLAADSTTQLVTYWGKTLEQDGSWVALLLVDPCPTRLDEIFEEEIVNPLEQSTRVPYNAKYVSPRNYEPPPELSGMGSSSREVLDEAADTTASFFDELVRLILVPPREMTDTPSSATANCYRLVLAKEAAATLLARSETISLTLAAAEGLKEVSEFNFDKFDERAWRDDWRGEFFTDLWELREDLELLGQELRHNSFIVKRTAQLANPKIDYPVTQDMFEWENLLEEKRYAMELMGRTIDSYVQTVQATGAQFANLQAKRYESIQFITYSNANIYCSVGRLTG